MKTKRTLYWITTLSIALLCGCTDISKEIRPLDCPTFKLDVNNISQLNIADFAEFSTVIPLETSTESIIGQIKKVFIIDSLILVWDHKGHNVLLFNEKGKYKHRIGKQGGAPEEYKEIMDVYVTSENLIQILDNKSRRILTFNLSGEYIDCKTLPYYLYSFYPTENGIWGVNSYQNEERYYLIHLPSSSTDQIDFGYFSNQADLTLLMTNNFETNEKTEDVFFHYCYDDIIYKIEEGKLNPYIDIDFGDQKAPYNYDKTEELDEKMITNSYLGQIHNLYAYGEHLFFSFYRHETNKATFNEYQVYISTKTGDCTVCQYDIKHSDEITISPIPNIVGISDGKLIYQIIPDILPPNLIGRLNDMMPDNKVVAEDSNPVLVLYKLK